ncbi:MAG: DUF3606 domain-containing protein [Opitutaceae bacterium]|nr:DUF3606 domain-containing protein [Cytophagales bacterium]
MDNKKNVGSPDKDRINVNEKYELEYWTKELGVTSDKLKQVVSEVGTSVSAVKEKLSKK